MGFDAILDESMNSLSLSALAAPRQRLDTDASLGSDLEGPVMPPLGKMIDGKRILTLDGYSLTVSDLVDCHDGKCHIVLDNASRHRIMKARTFLEKCAAEHKIVYGITTGFGTFSNVQIGPNDIRQLQLNLIRSHATGYGDALSPEKTRMLLALRINVLAKGHSGISVQNVDKLVAAFNAYAVPYVPEQGTVGCSGDLCPLAHLALGLLGEGRMWSPITGWDDAATVLAKNGLTKLELGPKEGLALINGTQMVTALGALAVKRAEQIAKQADVVAALTLDVLKGTTRAFDAKIHRVRPHKGQNDVAQRLRALLHSELNPSEIAESHRNCGRVQDAYTLRCVPQVHGVVHETVTFVKGILTKELNSATDNPLIFPDQEEIISGGNFHGEYPAKALDFLAIGVHELAQMSERRLERLVNHELSGLPTFLTKYGGLNSGLMTVQLCAASLVSENKVLCHPASADSIPTSCNQEDHVSMGGFAARKALKVVEHVEAVLSMELIAACQALEFLKPLKSTTTLQKVYDLVRTVFKPLEEDRYMQPEIQAVIQLMRENKIWETVAPFLGRMADLESDFPDVLRQNTGSPTAALPQEADAITCCRHPDTGPDTYAH
uniref:Histidine ammonia-lyase n=1 Tax=Panagrellus redivivus TaxID=6233 RepID=A0A7E4W1E2_PANRE